MLLGTVMGKEVGWATEKRVSSERPNWMKNAAIPWTQHEIALAVECTSRARATCDNWNLVLIQAAFAYNCKVSGQFVAHGSRGCEPESQASKEYLAPTTSELLGGFWIRATKSNSNEQLRQKALAWGVAEGGRDAPVLSGGPRTKAAGSAGPGEIMVMTDEKIERLGLNRLRETLRSLDAVGVGNKLKAFELKRRLKDAVKAGTRKRLNPPK